MKTMLIHFLFLLAAFPILAQTDLPTVAGKGATPLSPALSLTGSPAVTRAVVVGISDYQAAQIPDLQFAHRDAEAFAAWLQSPAGGSVPEDNILLLTNQAATNASVITALFGMLDVCSAGDQVIFYFSGHGDVESKTRTQPGFLLTYDSPPSVYMAGALNLRDLQEIVTTLSEKQVKVALITDACHAGKLTGNSINGTSATTSSLSQQFANEVKIMSCQPSEFSLEGEQWGGGRGVFSYFLLKGLTGLADKNGDGSVSLTEIDRYLGDRVPPETAPQVQTPFTVGDRNAAVALVNAPSLARLMEAEAMESPALSKISAKGIEDEVLAKADAAARQQYTDFKNALAAGILLEPADSSAWHFFQLLSANAQLEPLHRLMRRNLAVALLDEVQQALNALLTNDPEEAIHWQWNPDKYQAYPIYLERAMDLLGKEHVLHRSLMSKKLYFEAYGLSRVIGDHAETLAVVDSLKKLAKAKLLQAIKLEPGAAYLYHSVGMLYNSAYTTSSLSENGEYLTDSLVAWCEQATRISPGWLVPYGEIFIELLYTQMNEKEAIRWLDKGLEIDSNNYNLLDNKVWAYMSNNNTDEAERISHKLINLRPDIGRGYGDLAYALMNAEKYEEAEPVMIKATEMHPNSLIWGYIPLGINYSATRRFSQAQAHFAKALHREDIPAKEKILLMLNLMWNAEFSQDFTQAGIWADSALNQIHDWAYYKVPILMTKAYIMFQQGNYTESEALLHEAISLDPTINGNWIIAKAYLGLIAEKRGGHAAAEDFFKQAEAYRFVPGGRSRQVALYHYGAFLLRQNRLEEARHKWEQLVHEFPRNYYGYYGLALYHAKQGNKTLALDYLEKSLDYWYPVPMPILEEPLFKKIRKTKRFKALMKKHFNLAL